VKEGWEVKRLGEVCDFDKNQDLHRGLPYVGLENIESNTARFIGSKVPQAVKSSTFRFSQHHVLYGRLRPYLNKALAPDFDGHCSTEIFPLKPSSILRRDYLLYWLLSDETCTRINETCTGTRMPRAQMNEVLGFEFPLPPLPDQKRIVGILDEAFAGIDTAKANAEKNLQNARALFESHLQSVFSQRGEGWVETTIGDQLILQRGFDITKKEQIKGTVPVVSSGGIKSYHNTAKSKGPGVVIGRKGTLGKVFYIEGNFWPHDTTLWVKDFKGNEEKFVFYLFLGLNVKKLDSGTANPALNRNQVHPITITWPQVAKQKAIVEQLDTLSAETQRLAGIYERKLAALEALKKSLLHRAFAGEL
jgi:type I restriction enzyme S subunit